MPRQVERKNETTEVLRIQLRSIGRKALRLLHVLDGNAPVVEILGEKSPPGTKFKTLKQLSWDDMDFLDDRDFKDLVSAAIGARVSWAELKALKPRRGRRG